MIKATLQKKITQPEPKYSWDYVLRNPGVYKTNISGFQNVRLISLGSSKVIFTDAYVDIVNVQSCELGWPMHEFIRIEADVNVVITEK
jgi:hypothetical protein